MALSALIWFLLIGLIAGWLAGKVMRGGGYGIIGDMIVGVIGALLGGWLFSLIGISAGGLIGAIITAFVGAVVLIAILVRLTSPGPILFRQLRQGQGGRPFWFLKFRTMTADAEHSTARSPLPQPFQAQRAGERQNRGL